MRITCLSMWLHYMLPTCTYMRITCLSMWLHCMLSTCTYMRITCLHVAALHVVYMHIHAYHMSLHVAALLSTSCTCYVSCGLQNSDRNTCRGIATPLMTHTSSHDVHTCMRITCLSMCHTVVRSTCTAGNNTKSSGVWPHAFLDLDL